MEQFNPHAPGDCGRIVFPVCSVCKHSALRTVHLEFMVNEYPPSGQLGIGGSGEETAARYLRGRGYTILARNAKTTRGEIDIIAEKGGTIVFVEVKSRAKSGAFEPSDRVNRLKVRRIESAAALWLDSRPLEEIPARIDVIGVSEGKIVEHYEDVTS